MELMSRKEQECGQKSVNGRGDRVIVLEGLAGVFSEKSIMTNSVLVDMFMGANGGVFIY